MGNETEDIEGLLERAYESEDAAEVEELTGFPVDAVSDQSRAARDGVMASALASAVPL